MFRVGLFMDRLNKAKPELDKFAKGSKEYNDFLESVKVKASKEARKAFIDYNIQAEAATRQPHKFF